MSNLLTDVALMDTRSTRDGWTLGEDAVHRGSSVKLALVNVCATPAENVLVDPTPGVGSYDTRPFVVQGSLEMMLRCFTNDDPAWLDQVLIDSVDLAAGRALVTQPMAGYGADAVWIGHDDVTTIDFAGDPALPKPLLRAISNARAVWYSKNVGGPPFLNIAPSLLHVLSVEGYISRGPDGVWRTLLGDAVIASNGYDNPDPDVNPVIFWSGPIMIVVSSAETTGVAPEVKLNRGIITSSIVGVINVAPASIVRVNLTWTAP